MNTPANIRKGRMLIGGELVAGESDAWLESLNPATEELIGYMPAASAAYVNRAVAAAEKAQPAWGALDASARGKLVSRIAAALRERATEILQLEVIDTGNTITKMKGDVEHAAHAMEFFAGLGTEIKGESIPASADNLHVTLREPYGVVGRIVPFNHPIKFAAHAIAAPLMAGNTVVVKPPEQSPLSAEILGEI